MSRRCGTKPNKDGGTIAQRCAINRRRTARRLPAFTLIELVVVISLILLLVGLTMSVGLAVRSQSETRQTENVLILLDQAVKQWQIAADRQLSWGMSGIPPDAVYDIQSDDPDGPEGQFLQLLARIRTNSAARDILAQIDNDFLQQVKQEDGTLVLQLVDPWGSPVYLIHPGTVDPVNAVDPDGTIRVSVGLFGDKGHEDIYGVARNRQLLFVSAGPDGEFGDLHLNMLFDDLSPEEKDEVREAADNVYSYAPSLERPLP